MAEKPKLLTLKLDFDTYAEFSAAVAILRGRTMSALVYTYVISKIREAREMVSTEEFERVLSEHKEEIIRRSQLKANERIKGVRHKVLRLTEKDKRERKTK